MASVKIWLVIAMVLFSAVFSQNNGVDSQNENNNEQPQANSDMAADESFQKYLVYLAKYGKKYNDINELAKNYNNYKNSLKTIEEVNKQNEKNEDGGDTFGENEFSDLSPEEFSQKYLSNFDNSTLPNAPELVHDLNNSTTRNLQGRNLQYSIPASVDWRASGVVTAVKNQGSCGSCWSFATIAMIESRYAIKYGVARVFAEQQLIDCNIYGYACGGGTIGNALGYVQSYGGVCQQLNYGYYLGYRSYCRACTKVAGVSSYAYLGTNEANIQTNLALYGPVATAMNASQLQYYTGGIITLNSYYCNPYAVNHAVTLVGYGVSNGLPYWIVKNSWGAYWGESGYFRIARGYSTCGIGTMSYSATVY